MLVNLLEFSTLFYLRFSIVTIFTSTPIVVQKTNENILLLLILMALDFCQAVLCGAIKALGKQKPSACINMITYYVFAIPIAILLAFDKTPWFQGLGQKGLWTGTIVGMAH